MNNSKFPCDQCGKCCRNLNKSPLYADLHDGAGICRYLNQETNLCTIYEKRPEKCNIIDSYYHFHEVMTFHEYIERNIASCRELKEE